MAEFEDFSALVKNRIRSLTEAAEASATKSAASAKKVAKAAYRARVGVAQKGGKLAFVAMGVPAVAAGFEAWAAATEAQRAATAKKREKAFIWARVGALAVSSVACCAAPWIGAAALVASGAAAGASLIAASGNFAEAARERSKGRGLSAASSSSIGAVRLAAFSVMAVAAAVGGAWMLPIAAVATVGSETLVSALDRKKAPPANVKNSNAKKPAPAPSEHGRPQTLTKRLAEPRWVGWPRRHWPLSA